MATDNPTLVEPPFPGELWDKIVEELEPSDVLALSMTCKAKHSRLSTRDSWKRVLRSVCLRKGVFLPSYSFAGMDTPQIQRAASRHQRWKALVHKHAVPFENLATAPKLIPVYPERCIRFPQPHSHLVPGGRCLLQIEITDPHFLAGHDGTETTGAALQVWDLGSPGAPPSIEPDVIASYMFSMQSLTQNAREVQTASFVLDESSLLVMIVFPICTEGQRQRSAEVLHVRFGAAAPSIVLMSSMSITPQRGLTSVELYRERALFLFEDLILVWDTHNGAYCKWVLASAKVAKSSLVYATNEYVVYVTGSGIILWDTTNMNWRAVISSDSVDVASGPEIIPEYVLPEPWLGLEEGEWFFSHARSAVSVNTLEFDAFSTSYRRSTTVVRYNLRIFVSRHGDTKGDLNLSASSVIVLPDLDSQGSEPAAPDIPTRLVASPRTTRASICYGIDQQNSAWRSFAYVPIDARGPTTSEVLVKAGRSNSRDVHLGARFVPLASYQPLMFCPLSGRAVYSGLNPGGAHVAYIVDYVT